MMGDGERFLRMPQQGQPVGGIKQGANNTVVANRGRLCIVKAAPTGFLEFLATTAKFRIGFQADFGLVEAHGFFFQCRTQTNGIFEYDPDN